MSRGGFKKLYHFAKDIKATGICRAVSMPRAVSILRKELRRASTLTYG